MDSKIFPDLENRLLQISSRLQQQLSEHPSRDYQHFENLLKRRASLLIGARGVGKTTFLLKKSMNKNSFYMSMDNPMLSEVQFFDFADYLFQGGYDLLVLDEVHFLKNWSIQLKALYDSFPQKRIIATDSSSLVLRRGLGDLSRRFVVDYFPYLSFREYLLLSHNIELPVLNWLDLKQENFKPLLKALTKSGLSIPREFKKYLESGTRPFFVEGDYRQKTLNILEKIVHVDIPYFLPEIKERHLQLMKHVIGHLALSPIPTVNVDSFAKEWSVAKTTVYNLLELMHESGVLRIISEAGRKGQTKGKKIFFADPNMYSCLDGALGNLREAFFTMTVAESGLQVTCPKMDQDYDFLVDGVSFEIGGPSKKRKNANFVVRDTIDLPTPGVLPLWIFGFLPLIKK